MSYGAFCFCSHSDSSHGLAYGQEARCRTCGLRKLEVRGVTAPRVPAGLGARSAHHLPLNFLPVECSRRTTTRWHRGAETSPGWTPPKNSAVDRTTHSISSSEHIAKWYHAGMGA